MRNKSLGQEQDRYREVRIVIEVLIQGGTSAEDTR